MSQIEHDYIKMVHAKIDLVLREATTDREAWLILQRLREQTAAGMTWDEQGIKRNLTDYQIEQTAEKRARNSQTHHAQEFLWASALFIGVLLWLGSQSVARPTQGITVQQAGSIQQIESDSQPPQNMAQPVMLEIVGAGSKRIWLPITAAPHAHRESAEPQARWSNTSTIHYQLEIDPAVWQQINQGTRLWLQMDHAPSLPFICQSQQERLTTTVQPGITLHDGTTTQQWWCPYDFNLEPHTSGEIVPLKRWGHINENVSVRVDQVLAHSAENGQPTIQITGKVRGTIGTNDIISFRLLGSNSSKNILGQSSPHPVFGEEGEWYTQFIAVPNIAWGESLRLQVISGQGGQKYIDLGVISAPAWQAEITEWEIDHTAGLMSGDINWSVTQAQWITTGTIRARQGDSPLQISTDPPFPFYIPLDGQRIKLLIETEPDNTENILLEIGQERWLIERATRQE